MESSQSVSYSQSLNNFQPEHIKEFRDSAIDDDIAALNFWSFDGTDENELDEVFSLLIEDPKHNNNGIDIADPSFAGNLSKQLHLTAAKLSEGTKDSAIGRVAKRFALLQISLGLAHKYGLLPFDIEQVSWAISECFNAWLKERGGDGSIEVKQAITKIRHLLISEQFSNRVMDVKPDKVKGNQKIEKPMGKLLAYRKIDSDGIIEGIREPPPLLNRQPLASTSIAFQSGVPKSR